MVKPYLLRVAVPAPLRHGFDYLCAEDVACGCRVVVPFGGSTVTGMVVGRPTRTTIAPQRLRWVQAVADSQPLVGERLLRLLLWAADYYQHPLGEVIKAALPGLLGGNVRIGPRPQRLLRLTEAGRDALQTLRDRAPVQYQLAQLLHDSPEMTATEAVAREGMKHFGVVLRALSDKGLVEVAEAPAPAPAPPVAAPMPNDAPKTMLSTEQAEAVEAVCDRFGQFQGFVLHGITGSGKTEVYIAIVKEAVNNGGQALVLTPEISLTPQLVARFRRHFGDNIGVLHSGLAPAQRRRTWEQVRDGGVAVVLGTRSAVFAPLPQIGVIIVDEEHDGSYKQQDGFRYHARDLAVLRGRDEQVPVVLGSATPSFETLVNIEQRRYHNLSLPIRAGGAALPRVRLLDTRSMPVVDGLTPVLATAIAERLERGEQSLLFINRRGFAPVLLCGDCGWKAQCRECDSNLVLHRHERNLICHHCGARSTEPEACPQCASSQLKRVGQGTQRIEETMARRFPGATVERIDRDSTGARGALEQKLDNARSGRAGILVGTRMLCKGHDFPGLTLVGVVDADRSFHSSDFRALEYQMQQLLQVAGRAGRADLPGEVLIQTAFPDNPYLKMISAHDFHQFATTALAERREAGFPPYTRFVLIRSEADTLDQALDFLHHIKHRATPHLKPGILLMDPVPSPMERRQGRHRAQLLVQGRKKNPGGLQRFLGGWIRDFEGDPQSRKVHWSVDVDPMEMF